MENQAGSSSLLELFAPPTPPQQQQQQQKGRGKVNDKKKRPTASSSRSGGDDDNDDGTEEFSYEAAAIRNEGTPLLSGKGGRGDPRFHNDDSKHSPPPPQMEEQYNYDQFFNSSAFSYFSATAPSSSSPTSARLQRPPDLSSSPPTNTSPGGASSSPWNDETTPKTSRLVRKANNNISNERSGGADDRLMPLMLPIVEETAAQAPDGSSSRRRPRRHEEVEEDRRRHHRFSALVPESVRTGLQHAASECSSPSTYIGSFMFLLYHVVFSLTMGATITRPHHQPSASVMLGLFSKMAALGIMLGSPVYWLSLPDIPALYPTVDLFAAPFLANLADIVDETLFLDPSVSKEDNDQIFLATFTFLASMSIFLSGTLLVLASVFKLANLGAFLPFPVLCGFFSAVGVLMWTMAFKVDTGGVTIGHVLGSGDSALVLHSMVHHAPSIAVAAIMKYLGPKNPLYVVMLVFSTIGLFFITMLTFGISLDEMIEKKWFWSSKELVYEPMVQKVRR
jgi:Sulfate permease family